MKYSIKQNWIDSLSLITKNPILLLPFIIIAFLEGLGLELAYFAPAKPIALVAAPIIRKFFGEAFLHYPGGVILLPQLLYYVQIFIYAFFGVFLSAITINLTKNIKEGLPLKPKALLKNALARYPAFLVYGIIIAILVFLLRKVNAAMVYKVAGLASYHYPNAIRKVAPFGAVISLFLANLILSTFTISALPIIVIKKVSLIKAFAGSVYLGLRKFFRIFILIFVPYTLFLPVVLLKSFPGALTVKAFPETIPILSAFGIFISIFVECFVIVSISQFLLAYYNASDKK